MEEARRRKREVVLRGVDACASRVIARALEKKIAEIQTEQRAVGKRKLRGHITQALKEGGEFKKLVEERNRTARKIQSTATRGFVASTGVLGAAALSGSLPLAWVSLAGMATAYATNVVSAIVARQQEKPSKALRRTLRANAKDAGVQWNGRSNPKKISEQVESLKKQIAWLHKNAEEHDRIIAGLSAKPPSSNPHL